MDFVVLDVPDTWGILLSRKWVVTLGSSLHMDLFYATIPIGNESHTTLYNQPKMRTHMENPGSDSKFDTSSKGSHYEEPINHPLDPKFSQDFDDLPFSQKEHITDVILPKREDYQGELDKYKDKGLGYVIVLKKGNEIELLKDD
jgi:hypothetical protein